MSKELMQASKIMRLLATTSQFGFANHLILIVYLKTQGK